MMYDSIVIGAGPAGVVAALQMKRAGLNVVLFESGELGGLLRNANFIENYLGFPNGVSGRELVQHFQDHLCKYKVPLFKEEVLEIKKEDGVFSVHTSAHAYQGATVVVATGTMPRKAGIEGEEQLSKSNIFYEVADLPEGGKKKSVVVIGGGDAAFDYALNLSSRWHAPTIVTRGTVSCLPILKERVEKEGIPYLENSLALRICKAGSQLEVQCETDTFKADYVLIAVGREPRYPRIATKNKEGLYFVGDVRGGRYRQVHIATGDALRVAMEISHSLLTTQS